jgi:hypothetical protein
VAVEVGRSMDAGRVERGVKPGVESSAGAGRCMISVDGRLANWRVHLLQGLLFASCRGRRDAFKLSSRFCLVAVICMRAASEAEIIPGSVQHPQLSQTCVVGVEEEGVGCSRSGRIVALVDSVGSVGSGGRRRWRRGMDGSCSVLAGIVGVRSLTALITRLGVVRVLGGLLREENQGTFRLGRQVQHQQGLRACAVRRVGRSRAVQTA